MRNVNSPRSSEAAKQDANPFLPALLLLCLVVAYRVWMAWLTTHGGALPMWLPGFCPVAALALGSGWFLPRRLALVAPLAMLLLSDLALTAIYGWHPLGGSTLPAALVEMATRYALLFGLVAWALQLRLRRGATTLLGATVVGSLGFYVVTNTVSWLALPGYAPTLAGWWQSLTTGLPGYPPSWIFFRNALVSDLLYSILLLLAFRFVPRSAIASAPEPLATSPLAKAQ